MFHYQRESLYCILICGPPKSGFLEQVSELSMVMPSCDRVLIVGDFHIHICSDNLLAIEFLNIVESFNFSRIVTGSTHNKDHVLDLVLSHDVSESDICGTK